VVLQNLFAQTLCGVGKFSLQALGFFSQLGIPLFGGSFFSDALPTGADVISLVRVIFDHDDARALMILKAVRRALPPDGTLLLTEPMAGTRGAEAMGDAYFGFYLLAMGKGRARSAERLTAMLHEAGFGEVRLVRNPMPLQTQLIVARPAPMENPRANDVITG
jgi:demethylspheroidene O-methyltransferase